MSFSETQIGKQQRCAPLFAGGIPPLEISRLRGQSRTILEGQLRSILSELAGPEAEIDVLRVRRMLSALSADIRSDSSVLHRRDYGCLLEQLTDIYARGFDRPDTEPFTSTAAAYAQVIETICHAHPGLDYREAFGHLFRYMSRLFRMQKASWKTIYHHILSIPDSVEAKQILDRASLLEIREWAEAGVENLFSIRTDLYEKIGELRIGIEGLDRRIAEIEEEPAPPGRMSSRPDSANIIDFAQARAQRHLVSLTRWRQGLEEQRKSEETIVGLIESDILEFEEKLKNTARAYFVRLV